MPTASRGLFFVGWLELDRVVATLGSVVLYGFVGMVLGHVVTGLFDENQRGVRGIGSGKSAEEQTESCYSHQLLHIPFLPAVSPGKNDFIRVWQE